jgi:2-oxoglutarate ferredoxin oxidoreductase subunit alpha
METKMSNEGGKVLRGTHFMMGNVACAEGAIAAGCNFAAGYPITPASEVVNRLAARLPEVGGVFFQTEDEISAICSAIGASWAGCKALTATSGPGISLMQENIGFAVATETPMVIVDVQRLGPSTGVPSVGLAGDMVQVARGSHGDYQIIALCPEDPQEMFNFVIRAFNLAERYRVPVFLMADGFVGHMRERVLIPEEDQLMIETRRIPDEGHEVGERQDFLDADVAPMPIFGRGFKAHVTSSCHDHRGMRNLSDPEIMDRFIKAPIEKILNHRDDIVEVEADYSGAQVVLVTYGTVARAARAAARLAEAEGIQVGTFRMVTCWPFPDREIREMAEEADYILVLENNLGQMHPYIKAEAAHASRVEFLGPQILGQIHDPEYIVDYVKEMVR